MIGNDEYWLYLDDVRPIPQGFVGVKNYDEFVKIINEKGLPSFVSFDHDLADEHYRQSMYNPDAHYSNYYSDGTFKEMSGYDCAKFLVDYCEKHNLEFPAYSVHSFNPIGKQNIVSYIESYKKSKLKLK